MSEQKIIIEIITECIDEQLWNKKYLNKFMNEDRVLLNTESHIRINELSYLRYIIENSPLEDPIEIINRKIKVYETPINYESRYCSALLKGLKKYITKQK